MRDPNLLARMAFVGAVLTGFYLALVKLGLSLGFGLPFVVVGLVIFVAVQYLVGTRGVLRQVGATDLPRDEFAAFHDEFQSLAGEMGFDDVPDLKVADLGGPNAFAVGRKGNGTVVVSIQLLERLDFDEAAAVAAHELAHLRNRDSIVMVIGESISTLVALVIFIAFDALDSTVLSVVGYLMAVLSKFAVMLFVLALSRYREYAADRTAARILGTGRPLARALEAIDSAPHDDPESSLGNVNSLCIVSANSGLLGRLVSTHPPMERRVERLEAV